MKQHYVWLIDFLFLGKQKSNQINSVGKGFMHLGLRKVFGTLVVTIGVGSGIKCKAELSLIFFSFMQFPNKNHSSLDQPGYLLQEETILE